MLKAVAGSSGGGAASGITIGTSVITGGTDKRLLYDNNGVIGETAQWTFTNSTGLLLGNLNAAAAPTVISGAALQIVGADATIGRVAAYSFGAIAAFTVARANGTGATPTAIVSGDQLGGFNSYGYRTSGGAAYSGPSSSVQSFATENWTSTANGTKVVIATTPNLSTTLTTAITIDQNQQTTFAANITITGNAQNATHNTYDLGTSGARWRDLWLGNNATIGGVTSCAGSITFTAISAGIILKQGANGRVGTFVANGATPVTVSNTSVAITDAIIISLNAVGGAGPITQPVVLTITASTGFTVGASATDTSTYNYAIIKNAA